jgi:hypothetical protein
MAGQNNATAMWSGIGPVSVSQDYDMKMLTNLLDGLRGLIDTNDEEADLMCDIADSLTLEPERRVDVSENGHVSSSELGIGGFSEPGLPSSGSSLEIENQQLAELVQRQVKQNEAISKLLAMSRLSLQTCLDSLRGYVESKSLEIIEIHKDSLDKISKQRESNLELLLLNAQLENMLFRTTRNLGTVLNKSINYKDTSKSVEYLQAKAFVTKQAE